MFNGDDEVVVAAAAAESLEVQLRTALEEEGLDGVAELYEKLKELRASLATLKESGKEGTSAGRRLQTQLDDFEKIEALDIKIKAKQVVPDPLQALRAQIQSKLEDEGLSSVEELFEKLKKNVAELADLTDQGKGETAKGRRIKAELESLQAIQHLVDQLTAPVEAVLATAVAELPMMASVSHVSVSGGASASAAAAQPSTVLPLALPKFTRSQSLQELEVIRQSFAALTGGAGEHQIPDCAEKSLATLCAHFQNEAKKKEQSGPVLLTSAEVLEVFAKVQQQLSNEGFDDASLLDTLRKIEAALVESNAEFLAGEFWKLLKEIQPLDMQLMISLIEKTDEAAKKIAGKDIVLLLGGTGAGKSTTIHWLAGSKMQKIFVEGLKHIAPIEADIELESVTTSPYTRSETRSINAVKVSHERVPSALVAEGVLLSDTPGFEDTDGAEIDIANGLGSAKGVRLARSVRPLVLFSKNSMGDRFQGLLDISRILVRFVGSIEQHLPTFSYVFTKYFKEESAEIHPFLDYKFKHLLDGERTDRAFVALLEDIVKKTVKGACVVDPINDDPKVFWDALAKTSVIENPQEVFRDFVTPESLDRLKEQLGRHHRSVHLALKRFDVAMLRYKLDQLAMLNAKLSIHEVKKTYDECVREGSLFAQDLLTKSFQRIDVALQDGNTSIAEDVIAASEIMLKLISIEPIRRAHFVTQSNLEEACLSKIMQAQHELLGRIKTFSVEPVTATRTHASDSDSDLGGVAESKLEPFSLESTQVASVGFDHHIDVMVSRLDKMKLIAENIGRIFSSVGSYFDTFIANLHEAYKGACDYLQSLYLSSSDNAQSAFLAYQWPTYVIEMDRLRFIMDHFSDHLDITFMRSRYEALQTSAVNLWRDCVALSLENLSKDELAESDIAQIHDVLEKLNLARRAEGLHQHIDIQMLVDHHESILDRVISVYLPRLQGRILVCCQEESPRFTDIKHLLSQVDALRVYPELAHHTHKVYQEIIDVIRRVVLNLKEKLLSGLVSLSSNKTEGSFDYVLFARCLADLNAATCLAMHDSNVVGQEFEQIKTQLLDYLSASHELVQACDYKFSEESRVFERYLLVRQGMSLLLVQGSVAECVPLVESMQKSFIEKVLLTLKSAISLFSNEGEHDLQNLKYVFDYLRVCQKMTLPEIAAGSLELSQAIAHFTETYFAKINHQFDLACSPLLTGEVFDRAATANQLLSLSQQLSQLRYFYVRNPLVEVSTRASASEEVAKIDHYWTLFEAMPTQLMQRFHETVLPQHLVKLAADLEKLAEAKGRDQLYEGLLCAQAFRVLDEFIKTKPDYAEMSVRFAAAIASLNDSLIAELRLHARTGRFDEFKEAVTRLDLTDAKVESAFMEVKKELADNLRQSLEAVMQDKASVKAEDTRALAELMKRTKTIVQSIVEMKDYLQSDFQLDLSSRVLLLQKNIYVSVASLFDKVDTYLAKNAFHTAEEWLQQITEVADSFTDVVFEHAELASSNVKAIILQAVADKKHVITEQLAAIVKQCGTLDLVLYPKEPPVELFMQLRAASADHAMYAAAENELAALIQNKIEALLLQAEQLENLEEAEAQILLIESIFPYLPVDIYGAFDAKLKTAKETIQVAKERYQRELDEDAVAGALYKMVDKLIVYAKKGDYRFTYDIKVKIRALIKNSAARFKADVARGDLLTVFENLPKAWNDWVYYSTSLGGLTAPVNSRIFEKYKDLYQDSECLTICIDMRNTLVAALQSLVAHVESLNESDVNSLELISPHFDKLVGFLNLKDIASEFYKDLLEADGSLESRAIVSLMKVASCFHAQSDIFNRELRSDAIFELKRVMDAAQVNESLLLKASHYADLPLSQALMPGFKPRMETAITYKQMRELFARELLALQTSLNQTFLYHDKTKTANAGDRDEFYKDLYVQYQRLKQAKPLAMHVDSAIADFAVLEDACHTHLAGEVNKVADQVMRLLADIPTDEAKIYLDFNVWYDNLRSFAEFFQEPSLVQVAMSRKADIDRNFDAKIRALRDEAWSEEDPERIADLLIRMKMMTINISAYKKRIDEIIDNLLGDYKKRPGGAQKIGMLGLTLNAHLNQGVSQMIIAEHAAFKGYALSLRNEKTLRFTADKVLEGLRGDSVDARMLAAEYKKFDEEYWTLVEKGLLNPRQEALEVVKKARMLADSSATNYKDKVRSLMAHVFAYWTLDNSKHYAEANAMEAREEAGSASGKSIQSKKNYLMQPHAAQVISIFRLLGMDIAGAGDVSKLKQGIAATIGFFSGGAAGAGSGSTAVHETPGPSNQLVQIGTGEGKSVTLAITAVVLSLMGSDVSCACYSEYLSARDYEAFQSVFHAFSISEFVHYGTFNKLCEDFINQQGDVRGLVEETVGSEGSLAVRKALNARPKILLIDEVDVFFNKDFYGNMYRPLAKLKDATVARLIQYVWDNRANVAALRLSAIQASAPYQACIARFREYAFLIEESVKVMLGDIKTFESHDYIVLNGQIGYKEQDGVSFDVSYGYKTLFAYFKEHAAAKVTRSRLEDNLYLSIDCGSFSYAEMPKQYQCVMGVTGTLETLSAPQKALLKEVYQIQKSTYMPSVYGANQLIFAGDSPLDVMVDTSAGYFMAIRNEINTRVESQTGSIVKRAVLVFFESTAKLQAFYHSRELADIKDQVRVMTEEVSAVDKEALIRQAVTSGSVTLLSREFGRGTDFICYDDRLIASGGVHVIQTFVSEELAEETQIKGRTARQGNKGSFSMVLLDTELEKFGIRASELEHMKRGGKYYSTIHELRCRFFDSQYPETMRYVDDIKRDHAQAVSFLSDLIARRKEEIKAFLLERNKALCVSGVGVAGAGVSRTICLMDATGSMSSLLQKSKNTVKTMFERAHAILDEKGIASAFELQFVVYRNYDCAIEYLLQASPWESKPENLRQFMDGISAHGGTWWEEAIEAGLAHVNAEANSSLGVSQVILIGDAAPNSIDQVRAGRAKRGEAYWSATPFSTATHYTTELERIKDKSIPVHAFYVVEGAKAAFQEIASHTNGRSEFLDIDSPAGAEKLTDVVTEAVLRNVGGSMGDTLVDAYRARFGRGYVSSSASTTRAGVANTSVSAAASGEHELVQDSMTLRR